MCCQANTHCIEVLNLREGELVTHSILLIKGRILTNAATAVACQLQQKQVELQLQQQKQFAQICNKGHFKILLDLQAVTADNAALPLQLQYCKTKLILHINYCSNKNSKYQVQPLLIVCQPSITATAEEHDRPKQALRAQNLQKINLNLRLVQSVYAEKLREAGFERHTFSIREECSIFHSKLTEQQAWQLPEEELWHYFASELINHFESQTEQLKFIGFIDCTRYDAAELLASGDYSYENIRKHLKAHAALGTGGLALFGSAFFYAWPKLFAEILPCFSDERPVHLAEYPDDSNYRRNWAGVYATTLGAVCHELGHTFDLGHTTAGVMGTGLDYLNRVFLNATTTEHLPSRIIDKRVLPATVKPRFTQVKKQTNAFLQKYHEQKDNDGFYFTRNCAIILSTHKWFRQCDDKNIEEQPVISWTENRCGIKSSIALRLIELRCWQNHLVSEYFEFDKGECSFEFSSSLSQQLCHGTHYIIVLTVNGQIERLQ